MAPYLHHSFDNTLILPTVIVPGGSNGPDPTTIRRPVCAARYGGSCGRRETGIVRSEQPHALPP